MDRARDELFSHIQRCGVLEAEADQREEWMADTIEYIAERYPDLSKEQLGQLQEIGLRYCAPAIPHGDPDEAPEQEAEAAATGSAGPAEVEPVTRVDEVADVEPAAGVEQDVEPAAETEQEEEPAAETEQDEEAEAEPEEGERDEVGVA